MKPATKLLFPGTEFGSAYAASDIFRNENTSDGQIVTRDGAG